MMKKITALVLALVLMMGLVACTGGTTQKESTPPASNNSTAPAQDSTAPDASGDEIGEHHFVLATTTPDTTSNKTTGQWAARNFVTKLEELSGGKMTAEVSWNSALGNTAQLFSQVSQGTIAMTMCGLDVLVGLKDAQDTAVFGVPYLFDSYDHIHRYIQSDYFQEYWKGIEASNNMVLVADLGPGPCRNLNTKAPVRSLEDVKNLKIRVAESPAAIAVWTAWGANPIIISVAELYSSLENNQCDGWENQISAFDLLKTVEVAPYISRIDYLYQGNVVLMNSGIYNDLNAAEQAILKEAFDYAYQQDYAQIMGTDGYEREEGVDIERMKSNPEFKGIFIPDEEIDLGGFKSAAKDVWYQLEGDLYSEGLVDVIRGMAEG